MAHFKEMVDYEEVTSMAKPGFGRHGGGGVQQFVVKETFEEVEQVTPRGRSGHHGGHRGNQGHGSGHFQARETKFERHQHAHRRVPRAQGERPCQG
uniref:Putative glycine-rich protein n=1 Tax=Sporobolus stapfianus TaxID=56623 RepID=Q9SM40_SPOST|nr:putative glycine-rich protein [Sporobolus stapfianus]